MQRTENPTPPLPPTPPTPAASPSGGSADAPAAGRPHGLAGLNPFRGLPNPREVWAWGMYDLANQSFTLLVVTMYFGIYTREVIAATPESGERLWGWMTSGSMLLVVLLSPFLGALADARAWKKELLVGTGLACAGLTCALGLVGPGQAALAALLFVVANVAFNLGENFLASFLPEISSREQMGRVGATGWTMGYIGALVLLLISVAAILGFGWKDPAQWRPLFVFSGVWFLAAMMPPVFLLRERRRRQPGMTVGRTIAAAGSRLVRTAREAGRFRQLIAFLAVFFVYSFGTYTVIFFAGIITKSVFDFGTIKLTLFILQTTVTAAVAAIAAARFQDRLGHRRTVLAFLACWAVSTGGLAAMTLSPSPPEWLFWILANGVGLGLGGIGTASRTLVGVFTPAHKTAEFFGLYGMVYKLSAVVGPLAFGYVKAGTGDAPALFLLCGFFVAGFLGMFLIDERAGMRAAREAEAEALARGELPDEQDAAAGAILSTARQDLTEGESGI